MTLFVIAFISGVLTALAPCVLPVLPVVLGKTLASQNTRTPYIVIGSLSLSIILFTLLLKATTLFIAVPMQVWTSLSGGVLILFGVTLIFPHVWMSLFNFTKTTSALNRFMCTNGKKHSVVGDICVGASLGPIFSTCSPTYFVILATVLPLNFFLGVFYIGVYTSGLALVLLTITVFGGSAIRRLSVFADPHGIVKRSLGIFFIFIGIMIAFGIMKHIEVWVLDRLMLDVTTIEYSLLERFIYE